MLKRSYLLRRFILFVGLSRSLEQGPTIPQKSNPRHIFLSIFGIKQIDYSMKKFMAILLFDENIFIPFSLLYFHYLFTSLYTAPDWKNLSSDNLVNKNELHQNENDHPGL